MKQNKKHQTIKSIFKNIALTSLIALNFTACSTSIFNQTALFVDEEDKEQISTKEMFKDKKGFKPINMDIKFQNLKNAKEVK